MNKILLQKYDILQLDKANILNYIENLNNDALHMKPGKDKWSLAQILFHIIKGEQYAFISMSNSLKPDTELKNLGLSASFKFFILKSALKTNIKFKAPPIARKVPESVNVNELLSKWNEIRTGINEVCLTIPKDKLNKGVFKHPYIGFINLNQTLDFLVFHLKHHLKQIEQISVSLKQN